MARGDAAEMRELLRRRLAEALEPAGWIEPTPTRGERFILAVFLRPLDDCLAATASIHWTPGMHDDPPAIIHLRVGVCFEPLRRLWPLLGDRYALDLLDEYAWPERADDDEDDEDDDEDDRFLRVSTAAEAQRAVETLAGVILREAVPFAERYGSLERLLDGLGYTPGQASVSQDTVALLAAAGRFDEARAALARYHPPSTLERDDAREVRRFVHQIGRYIDSGGDPSIVPSEPPPSETAAGEPPPVSEMWQEARAKGRARTEAVKTVRAMGRQTDRAELRAALERELAARGVRESPSWLEQTLDHLHDTPADQARTVAKLVAGGGRLAFRTIRSIRAHRFLEDLPDLTPPAWLDPPGRAFYPIPQRREAPWVEVELDEQAKPYLDAAYAALPQIFGRLALGEAWLDWEAEAEARLVVSLGAHRVGTLAPAAAAAYRPVMDAAAERDELPYLPARLTSRPERYLLEVQLPDAGS